MDWVVEVPRELIQELRNPNRKRPIKTILRENWGLVEKIDTNLKNGKELPETLPLLVVHLMQNFMTVVSFLVNPRKLSTRKRRSSNETPDEIWNFENDLREAQKDWKTFFYKYEKEFLILARKSKVSAGVNFHEELWRRSRLQKLTSFVFQIGEKVQNKTVSIIPPSRFLFAFVGFLASWTIVPVFNTPKKLGEATSNLLKPSEKITQNGYKNGKQNGKENGSTKSSAESKISKLIFTPTESHEKMKQFQAGMKNSDKFIGEREQEWQEKLNMYQKEISARLEVQEKRLFAEIEKFQEEKNARRQQEEEEFTKRMNQQDIEFHKIIKKIDTDRKKFSHDEQRDLLETCKEQDIALLRLLDMSLAPLNVSRSWEDHEDYWSSRLQILRNALASVRSEFWNFERYFRQHSENPEKTPNFVKTIYEMESASFGQTVTRAQTLINNQHEFFDVLFDKYDDDLFLKVLWKITSDVSSQLDRIILEMWSIAVNSSDFDHFRLRSAVLEIDPSSIPTTWRLKGICHSADPSDYEDALSNGSPSVHSHF
ncbi:Protein CBG11549 [Caenorhabditis briggsae]|uniref:Protein CBG11549 n=1 Tax=Caenorhabditis briggsae TaxID=6238 RepID=A8XDG7_CAEBR|nr:Protein CBG11549 [Caenorhabditis briggsae]CAP30686.2 Protein CBG11549 [Caenorhabditis briggsae]